MRTAAVTSLALETASATFKDPPDGLLHIPRHPAVVVAPPPVKTKYRDPTSVNYVGIDFTITVFIVNHLATAFEADVAAIARTALLFQWRAVSFVLLAHTIKVAGAGHAAAPIELDWRFAHEFVLAVKLPPRNVHVHPAHTVVIVRRNFG